MKTDSLLRTLRYLMEIALASLGLFMVMYYKELFGLVAFFITPQKILFPVGTAVLLWIVTYRLRDDISSFHQIQFEWHKRLYALSSVAFYLVALTFPYGLYLLITSR